MRRLFRITSYNVCYTKLLRETIEAEAPAEEVVVPQVTEEVVAAVEAPKATVTEKEETSADHEDSSDFASAFEKTMTRIHNGQVLEGTVISIVDGEVFVNVGYKSDGVIPMGELSSDSDVKAVITSYSIHYTKLYETL